MSTSISLRPQVDYLKMRRARQDAMLQNPLPINSLVADVIARRNQLYCEVSHNDIDTIKETVKIKQVLQIAETKLSNYKHDKAIRSNVEKMRSFLL